MFVTCLLSSCFRLILTSYHSTYTAICFLYFPQLASDNTLFPFLGIKIKNLISTDKQLSSPSYKPFTAIPSNTRDHTIVLLRALRGSLTSRAFGHRAVMAHVG
jgi:hypothetical protein